MEKIKMVGWFALAAFVLNYIWEMAQMPFYVDMHFSDLKDWLFCLMASAVDVGMILSILIVGRWIFGSWQWSINVTLSKVFYLLLSGALLAVGAEIFGIKLGYWQYSRLMPTLPGLSVGLLPLAQMLVLPVLSYKVGWKWTRHGPNDGTGDYA